MNNNTKKIQIPRLVEVLPTFTITTFDLDNTPAVYEDVSDYSVGGGFLGMRFKDGSASYQSLELHKIKDIDVAPSEGETHE